MPRRVDRVWIALVTLTTLLIPAAGSIAGAPQDRLERTEDQLEELRDRIRRHETEARSLEDSIEKLNDVIIGQRNEVDKLNAEIAEIESRLRTVEARISQTKAKMDRIEEVATEQAVALYKSGATDTLDALINSRSLSELDARVEMLGVAAQENTSTLIQYGRLKVEIQAHHRELFETKSELDDARAAHQKVLDNLDNLYARQAEKLEELETKLGQEHAQEGALENASARIEQTILERTTLASVAALGKSDTGFIWPLNGGITSYYGERWGRMHTGIDIDGTTGEPVVASKSGRVILASSYSGYGNSVIIDHGGGFSTLYAHLSGFEVSGGQDVSQGEIIGRVGCTGSCTGDHLHFEVRVNGAPRDPMDYLP
ncbi:MAG: murein hydrolase activator EnvC family protein [Actinomycetota bacterium]